MLDASSVAPQCAQELFFAGDGHDVTSGAHVVERAQRGLRFEIDIVVTYHPSFLDIVLVRLCRCPVHILVLGYYTHRACINPLWLDVPGMSRKLFHANGHHQTSFFPPLRFCSAIFHLTKSQIPAINDKSSDLPSLNQGHFVHLVRFDWTP
jgi:hypothetical protein